MKKIISSVVVSPGPVHDRITIFNRGGLAGEITVEAGDGPTIEEALLLVNLDDVTFLRLAFDKIEGTPLPPAESKLAARLEGLIFETMKRASRDFSESFLTSDHESVEEVLRLQAELLRSTGELVGKVNELILEIDAAAEELGPRLATAKRLAAQIVEGFGSQGEEPS